MTKIDNKSVAELAEVICDRVCKMINPPTRAEITEAFAMAYKSGKCDGALDAVTKFAETFQK